MVLMMTTVRGARVGTFVVTATTRRTTVLKGGETRRGVRGGARREVVVDASRGGGGWSGRGGGGGGGDRGDGGEGEDEDDRPRRRRVSRACVSLACALAAFATVGAAPARAKGKAAAEPRLDALDFTALFSRELGISGVVGVGVGVAVKALGSKVLVGLASAVAALRWLELNDIVDVKWDHVHALTQRTAQQHLDLNRDGKIDEHDLFALKAKVVNFYTSAVPSAAGFSAGFALGLRYG